MVDLPAEDLSPGSSATPQPAVSPECEQKHAALLSQQGELAQLERLLQQRLDLLVLRAVVSAEDEPRHA